jgi:penicillin-binding protein 2
MKRRLTSNPVFQDEIAKYNTKTKHFNHSTTLSWNDSLVESEADIAYEGSSIWHQLVFPIVIIVLFALIFTRLIHLQVAQGASMRALADSNRIVVKVIHAPRGVIYDRNGKILAQNEPGFRLLEATGSGQVLTRDQALALEINNDAKFNELEVDNLRSYPQKDLTAHVLGYVSQISKEELQEPKYQEYLSGDRVGRGGVEETYEKVLRGRDGGEVIEVDAQGNKLRTLGKTDPIPGQNLKLSLDLELQKATHDALQDALKKSNSCCGAAVVSDPKSGQILALVSLPSFDPSNIALSFQNPNSPILNRVIGGTYPPASTFKIATSLAGLMSGKITPSTKVVDTGVYSLGPYKFANWYFTQYGLKETEPVDVIAALKRSNDIFFYHLGEVSGEVVMGDYAKKLGFNKLTGIDLPQESLGLIPSNEWKVQNYDQIWYPGDSINMSIGQGFVLATPIQINQLVSIIASDNKIYPPHLGWQILSPQNKLIKSYEYDPMHFDIKPEYLQVVKTGLEQVTTPGGTGWPFFTFPIPTAGKTGTAEFGHPQNKTHAWYTGYAPVDNPRIAATVLMEIGGEGSTNAAPVVKEIFRFFFSTDKTNLIKDTNASAAATLRE